MSENQKKKKNQLNSYIKYSSLTLQMAVIIAAGAFTGEYLDKVIKSDSLIFTIICSLSSIFFALYYVFKKVTNNNEKE